MTQFKVGDRVKSRAGEATVRAVDATSGPTTVYAVKFDSGEFTVVSSGDLTLVPDTVMVPLSRKDAETIAASTTPISPGIYVWAPEAMLTMSQACRTALEKPALTVRVVNGVTITDLGGGAEMREWPSGYRAYFLNGLRHRTDGPAIEWPSGYRAYFLNGLRHRTDGPAIEYASGNKSYYFNGLLHRTDGPAIEYASGSKAYCFNGQLMSEDEWKKAVGR